MHTSRSQLISYLSYQLFNLLINSTYYIDSLEEIEEEEESGEESEEETQKLKKKEILQDVEIEFCTYDSYFGDNEEDVADRLEIAGTYSTYTCTYTLTYLAPCWDVYVYAITLIFTPTYPLSPTHNLAHTPTLTHKHYSPHPIFHSISSSLTLPPTITHSYTHSLPHTLTPTHTHSHPLSPLSHSLSLSLTPQGNRLH